METDSRQASDASTGELIGRLGTQIETLVRDELQLAQLEMSKAGKRLGTGAGLFGVAGMMALYGLGALVATAVIALANLVDLWLAALIVTAVLFAIAGIAALIGKSNVSKAAKAPAERVDSVKADVAAATEHHGSH